MKRYLGIVAVLVTLTALTAFTASAAVMGNLNITSGAGGVTVTATTIDWTPTVVANDGPLVVSTGTTLTYGAGNTPLAIGTTGRLLDLSTSTTLPLAGFMTFTGVPTLAFNLGSLGPGVANTNCASLAVGQTCSAFTGSPFLLTLTQDVFGNLGTSVALPAQGTAVDGTGDISQWTGAFTTQLTQTPAQVQSIITGGGSITSSHSGSFRANFNPIPEPGTWSMILAGGGLMAFALRRRRS